jgi:hypothetical protein
MFSIEDEIITPVPRLYDPILYPLLSFIQNNCPVFSSPTPNENVERH